MTEIQKKKTKLEDQEILTQLREFKEVHSKFKPKTTTVTKTGVLKEKEESETIVRKIIDDAILGQIESKETVFTVHVPLVDQNSILVDIQGIIIKLNRNIF